MKRLCTFCCLVLHTAWTKSPLRTLIILTSIIVSSLATIGAPLVLGRGIAAVLATPTDQAFLRTMVHFSVIYALVWFIASAAKYLVYPLYGTLEQRLQSAVMTTALRDSISAPAAARAHQDTSEISFAIDSRAGTYRDTLASLILSLLPATISLISGIIAVALTATWREGLILTIAITVYAAVSIRLIDRHQKAQQAFFRESMRSFGKLSTSLDLWKEARLFTATPFLVNRYRHDRQIVERAGRNSYSATQRLYLAQSSVLAVTIAGLILSIALGARTADPAHVAATMVSTVGVCVASISPLQSVGFGLSGIATSAARHEESAAKITPAIPAPTEDDRARTVRRNLDELTARATTPGRPIWVTGPSGSGKTTLLEALLGLNEFTSPVAATWLEALPRRAYLPQTPGILDAPVGTNILFGRDEDDATVTQLLESLQLSQFLEEDNAGRSLSGEDGASGGERQRIALARALLVGDGLIVLDEPTSGLDHAAREAVWKLIEECAQKAMVIVATHDPDAPQHDGDVVYTIA